MSTYPDAGVLDGFGFSSPEYANPDVMPDFTVSPEDFQSPDFFNSSLEKIAQLIIQSQLYKQAYSIFFQDKKYGTPYLQQLQAIPYSYNTTEPSFWDEVASFFGATSSHNKAVADIFNSAMKSIRELLAAYQSFRNSLPAEQVDQLADAGINSSVTGQGITGSIMDNSQVSGDPLPSQSTYTNEQLNRGITSFVEFITLLSGVSTNAISSESILGMLNLAEQEGYNKQQVHDLMLAQLGISYPSSSISSLDGSSYILQSGRAKARVSAATDNAVSDALDKTHSVSLGNNPDEVQSYELLSGLDILNEVASYGLVTRLSRGYTDYLTSMNDQLFADILSRLENESQVSEASFLADYFSSRDGVTEGSNTTSETSWLLEMYKNDARVKRFDALIRSYREACLSEWSDQLEKQPSLAPFFYKAIFDFDMEDTFYHQSGVAQALKYGVESTKAVGEIITQLVKLKLPKPLRKAIK